MLNGQRERLMQQIGNDLNNTLAVRVSRLVRPGAGRIRHVCRVAEGKAYYQAALAAIRAGLAVGQSTSSLTQ